MAKNLNDQKQFKCLKYVDENQIDYEEYYKYDQLTKKYFCRLCEDFNKGTIYKHCIIRHLEKKHFFEKEPCPKCFKPVTRLDEHKNRCPKLKSSQIIFSDYKNKNIIFDNKIKCENNKSIFEIQYNKLKSVSFIKKKLLKESDKIVINNIFFYKNRILGAGRNGSVFIGGTNNNKELMAIKIIEVDEYDEDNDLFKEKNNLIILNNKGNFPTIFDFTIDKKYLYLAETLMGPTLEELIKVCNNEIDIISAINIALDLLNQIEIIHESNLIHGDIKGSNLCYGNLNQNNLKYIRTIGFIDFNSSKIFKNKNKIIDLDMGQRQICTREYASLDALKGKTYSLKDDLESIIYVIIKIYTKNLPWKKLDEIIDFDNSKKSINKEKYDDDKITIFKKLNEKVKKGDRLTREELIFLHENLNDNQICFGLPEEFILIYNLIKKLKYKEKPNYTHYKDLLINLKSKILLDNTKCHRNIKGFNGEDIIFKFKWEKIFYDKIYNNILPEEKNARESLEQIERKFCFDLETYINKIFESK